MKSGDRHSDSESERILNRVARETDGGSSLFARTTKRARDHITARDGEADDEVELWGARIGRVLGLFLVVGLTAYLVLMLAGG